MIAPRIPHFPHRHNQDGSWESICSVYILTVAREKLEMELEAHEKAHVCDGLDLKRVFGP